MRAFLPLLCSVAIGCGPKKPSSAAPTDFFPLVAGATWTYEGSFNGRSSIETRQAMPVQVGGQPAWVFLLEDELGDDVADTFSTMIGLGAYRRTRGGLESADLTWRSDLHQLSLDDFHPMLTLPPVVGAREEAVTRSVDRAGGWTVSAIEDVTVPAGAFTGCARLDLGQGSQAWLCPGVGLVKWVFVTGRVEELVAWQIP